MKTLKLTAACVLALSAASAANAALVGVDFGASGDPQPIGTPTNWTQIGAFGGNLASNLPDANGNPTGIDLTTNVSGGYVPRSINAGTLPIYPPDGLAGLNDFNWHANTAAWSDLVPGTDYKIWVFSVYDVFFGAAPFQATIIGTGAPTVQNFNMNVAGNLVINGTVGNSGNTLDSYATVVTASPTGTIDIVFASTGGLSGDTPLAGLAIESLAVVPEPASLSLLVVGTAALLMRRRRA